MRYITCTLAICVLLTGAALAADPPAGAPPPTTPPARAGHNVAIGPNDSLDVARPVRGTLNVVAAVPRDVQAATVEFYLDDKLQGSSASRPHRLSIGSAGIADGEHLIKAVAKSADGSQVWSATTRVLLGNAAGPDPGGPGPAGPPPTDRPTGPRPPAGPDGPDGPPPGAVDSNEPGSPPPSDANTPRPPRQRPNGSGTPPAENRPTQPTGASSLDKTYTSAKYQVTLRFPGTWAVSDDTAAKARGADVCWLTFGPDPLSSAKVKVNVHKQKIRPSTDADTFARYNDYVLLWERKSINGRSTFTSVTSDAGGSTHRAIILSPGAAWMFNCVDPDNSHAAIFNAMLNSFESAAL